MSDSQHDQKTKTEQLRGKLLAAWDKTRAQSLRAWEKTKAAAAVGWSWSRVFLGKARVAVAKHPVSPLLYVTVLSVAIGAIVFNGMYSRAYVLNVDGEEVGVIANEAELDAIVSDVESRVADILGEDYDYDAEITLTPAYATAGEVSNTDAVAETLFANVGALLDAYAISVDVLEPLALSEGQRFRLQD